MNETDRHTQQRRDTYKIPAGKFQGKRRRRKEAKEEKNRKRRREKKVEAIRGRK
jgi:hypothetical protein